jgi:L-asparaginase/Glu-tRNA(Gln) amidotransferase subunit D
VLVIAFAPDSHEISAESIRNAFSGNARLNLVENPDGNGKEIEFRIVAHLGDGEISYNLSILPPDSESNNIGCVERTCLELKKHYSDFNGFVVVREDSQIETFMSELSFAIESNSKSIVMVEHRRDLVEGLEYIDVVLAEAIEIASRFQFGEVCFYQERRLYRGNRMRRDMTGLLNSPNHAGLGDVKDGRFRPCFPETAASPFTGEFLFTPDFDRNLLLITLVPNQSPHLFEVWRETDALAIVIESYGIGNVPKLYQPFLDLIQQWRKAGKALLSYSQCDKGFVEKNYSTSFEDLGISSCSDMTPAAVLAKLGWLLAKGCRGKDLIDKMARNLRGETKSSQQSGV